jgi:uncharacterized protein (DUF488 family)
MRSDAQTEPPILTIGYGGRSIEEVLTLLHRHGIQYVGDVRSVPYSRRQPAFSREALERSLRAVGLRYVFFGDTLGGRPEDPECYDEAGHVDYERCRRNERFLQGIARVEKAYRDGQRLALLCSEGRPEDCHRSKLLAEMLAERGVGVVHIDAQGELVEHSELSRRRQDPQLSFVSARLGRSRRSYRAA